MSQSSAVITEEIYEKAVQDVTADTDLTAGLAVGPWPTATQPSSAALNMDMSNARGKTVYFIRN